MAKELKENRVVFMATDAELRAIDDIRFARRLGSRAEAIRQLLAEAIAGSPGFSIIDLIHADTNAKATTN